MIVLGALISISPSLGYVLPAIIGLESFGFPSPGETSLILASVMASEGKLQIWLVLVIGISSAIVGDSIGYELGRHLGREVLTAKGPLQKERVRAVDAGEKFFHKHGNKTIFFARWITGVRSAAAWLAGIDRMPYPTFLLYNAAGAITWGLAYGLVGYYGGQKAADVITKGGTYAAVVIVVIVVVLIVLWLVRRRRRAALEASTDDVAGPVGEPASIADAPGTESGGGPGRSEEPPGA